MNGLELQHIGSSSEPVKGIKTGELKTKLKTLFPENGFAVVYLDDRVLIGRWESGSFRFPEAQTIDENFVQKIRVFNSAKEFLAWRIANGFNGRLRKDDFQGSGTDVVIAKQVLVGTNIVTDIDKKGAGFTEIFEKRGTRLIVPFENILIDDKHNRVFIKTHNYVEYNPAGQATYADCRFTAFTDGKKDLL